MGHPSSTLRRQEKVYWLTPAEFAEQLSELRELLPSGHAAVSLLVSRLVAGGKRAENRTRAFHAHGLVSLEI